MRKKILEKRLARLMAKKNTLVARSQASTDVEEVKKINEELTEVNDEIAETQEELEALKEEPAPATEPTPAAEPVPPADAQARGGNPLGSYGLAGAPVQKRDGEEPYSSLEYRNAFMNFVQRGTPIPADVMARAGGDAGPSVTADIGMIIPSTIMNEFIKEVSKIYGQVYAKVRKLNVRGGVKFPISKLKASFTWITETTVSERQKAGDIKDFIEFSYNIGEIRVSETLLAQVVSLALFEREIVTIMVEAYVEAMDRGIIAGTGEGQLLGITKDPRVTNVVEFTAAEFADWKAWRKKLFAKVPLKNRGKGEFLFAASTVDSNLLTMTDGNNRPLFKEATELQVGENAPDGRFFGRALTMVEPDLIADFDTAAAGDVVGVYWVPYDYGVNTQLQFGIKRYFDEEKNEWVNKALTIVDGKIIDPACCWLIKKA